MPTQTTAPRVKSARDVHPSADQTAQLVAWLDEEHRRDKSQLSEALEQLGQHHTYIAGLAKNLQDFEERLARLQSQSMRYSQIEQSINQIKAEVQMMLDQYDQKRMQTEEEGYKVRQLERERQDQSLGALQMQVEALQQWQRATIGDHDVMMRVDLNLTELRQALDESVETYGDYQRRLLYIEDWISRSGQLTAELHQLSDRMRQERSEAAESNRRAEQQRARHMAEWSEQVKTLKGQLEEVIPNLKEQLNESKKRMGAIQEIEERLKQLEPRLVQWQKLADENRRKERDSLLSDVEKRWQQQLGEWQFLRDEWSKKLGALVDRIANLEDWRPDAITSLSDIAEKIDKEHRERVSMVSELLRTLNEMDRARDKILANLSAQIETEKSLLKKRPSTEPASHT
jgi:chromosome segregation ATPase